MIIGITGGISTGKSYVSSYLISKGYQVIDTDKIAHKLQEYNEKGFLAIKKHFPSVIDGESINRQMLAGIIFSDENKRHLLNSLMHPLVKEEVMRIISESKSDIIFVDVPLLYEANFDTLCDRVIVVYTDYQTQLRRLTLRDGIDIDLAKKKIASQMTIDEKLKRADYALKSEEDFNDTNRNIEDILKIIKEDI